MPTTPAERLTAALVAQDVSQQALAERLGVARSAVSQWVNGHRKLDVERIESIAAALGVRSSWLAFGEGPMVEGEAPAPPPPPAPKARPRAAAARKPTPKRAAKKASSSAPKPAPKRAVDERRTAAA